MSKALSAEIITEKILEIRGKRVMLDEDLAELYGVKTKRLKEQVKRNLKRFPEDFMFQLTWNEAKNSRPQFATLKQGQNIKYLPYVFTQEGVAMLSSALHSERAISVNIQIMRAFVALRRIALTYTGLKRKIDAMEKKYDVQFKVVFDALKKLLESPQPKDKRIIGFHAHRQE